ncbi:hypothetical protein AB0M11_22855 [Streptomyces sp. NPDC051987]|uniref:hypothetical protein n=1 Tax=Streptomyces sp. NPDC051987 TaxID=3155808 RepID=UPI0034204706
MDVPELLESASLLVPEETASENDLTVRDIWDFSGTAILFPSHSGKSSPKRLTCSGL